MIEHAVFFAVRPGADAGPMVQALSGLRDEIPGIVSLSVGENFTQRGKQFTHGLVVRLESRDALQAYLDHPAHVAAVEDHVKPVLDDLLALDWDVPDWDVTA